MIEASGLTRYYGDFAALRDASFSIEGGAIVGFLGLNGAGKSTVLKIIAGLLAPSAGTVKVGGVDASTDPDELRRKIGFLPEEPPLYREMRVREFLQWCGELKGRSRAEIRKAMPQVLATCDLGEVAERVIGELSHGYKKRVGIAQAIIHRPEVVILDEPISGLDPQQIVEMRRVVRSLKEHATVLISSHILTEVEQTCDRVLVIHRGRLVGEGAEEELSKRGRLALTVRGDEAVLRATLDAAGFVAEYDVEPGGEDGVHSVVLAPVAGPGGGDDHREALVQALVNAGLGVRELAEARSKLEQIFLDLINEGEPTAGKDEGPAASDEDAADDAASDESATEAAASGEDTDASASDESATEAAASDEDEDTDASEPETRTEADA